jgi:anti-anti-sigma factor
MPRTYRHISVSWEGGTLVLTVTQPELREYELACEVRDELVDAASSGSGANVVLDLRKVKLITSVGLLPLIRLRRVLHESGSKLVLCNLSKIVTHVLEVSQLLIEGREHARRLDVVVDLSAALAKLQANP